MLQNRKPGDKLNSIAEAVKNHDEAKAFAPAGRDDFLHYLDTVTTEEALFSRLTYWMVFRGLPAEQNEKYELVRQRALELKLWNGLDLKMERWKEAIPAEYRSMGDEAFSAQIGQDYADYINGSKPQQGKAKPLQLFTSKQLSEMTLPPIRYVVDGVIPMGMGLLVAKPKIGKSWMVLDLCLSVAAGVPFLSFQTRQHGTLYLALEDGASRMQARIRKVLDGKPAPEAARILFKAPRMDEGLLDALGALLDDNPDIHLVCIDTLSKIRPKAKAYENAYDADYDFVGKLKEFADSRGICVLLVHHTSKRKADDSFENINGSTGIMGASDFTIILDKKNRMDDEASFVLTGRDIEQQDRVVSFDKSRCVWTMQGTAAEIAEQRRIADYEANPVVKTLRDLLLQGDGTWTGNAQTLNDLGKRYAGEELAPTSQALAKIITELEPLLWERDAIKHWVKSNPGGGRRHCFKMNRTDNTAPDPNAIQLKCV